MTHPNMHPSAGAYSNAAVVAAEIATLGRVAERRTVAIVRHHTALLETRVKAGASGRPGPRAKTGDYRRGINSRIRYAAGEAVGTVGTASPQARRLEYGFVGRDRLGRTYNQPPFPHFGPAHTTTAAEFLAALRGLDL